MKLTFAFLSIVITLGFGACSTASSTKDVTLTSCTPGDAGKPVILETSSWAPGEHRVVRLAH
ncbi:MAG: hypothetical protein ABJF10_05720 [Chthoniobacter sp.]|uniref:hypothetical protein n=1 Tax=Chthoniobacter sp. TaxID=2510640 RepID=UPI0032AABC20